MFINLSNHPSSKWTSSQVEAAAKLGGEVTDLPFPNVAPTASLSDVECLAVETAKNVPEGAVVLVQGEFTLTTALVSLLTSKGVLCVCATTERRSVESTRPDGTVVKTAEFSFIQFRVYPCRLNSEQFEAALARFWAGYSGPSRRDAAYMLMDACGQSDRCPYCGTPNASIDEDGRVGSSRNGYDCFQCGSN